ncbi:MAG: PIG-L family deacetylase [Candidatus Margulisbacteria bacterium]|nr:PIG-L family deacetylase [Candidatus Margulisiibacteriota bacterium]MBU1617117.1 PIG-L family deacetylase [Candidatus Margulisiibacteriota bacterium]
MHEKILIVAAHPDDEVFGCGGTIAKLVKEDRAEVYLLVLGDGVTSRSYYPGISNVKERKLSSAKIVRRQKEMRRAAGILGIKPDRIKYCGYPDQRFDAVSILALIKEIEQVKNDFAPEKVFTHHWGDLNRDHRIAYEATITAFRPKFGDKKKAEILCYEIPGNMDILQPLSTNRFRPDVLVDITGTIGKKIEAVKAYESEWNDAGPLSVEGLISNAKKRAGKGKNKMVESFVRQNISAGQRSNGGVYEQ